LLLGSVLVLGLTMFGIFQLLACLSCRPQAFTCISSLASGSFSTAAGNGTVPAGPATLGGTAIAAGLLWPQNHTVQLPNGNLTTVAVPLTGSNTTAVTTLFEPVAAPPVCRDVLV